MQQLTAAVGRVDEVFHSLSDDTNEHAAGIEAIRDTMNELKDATQQNLEVAAQSRRIADDLAERAGSLNEAMSSFRLGDAGPSTPAAAPSSTPASTPSRLPENLAVRPQPVEAAAVEFF
jgi:hypothetical protein